MKSFVISDNHDTWVGMRLAGISGVVVHEKDEILKEIDKVLQDKEIGILIVTELIMEIAKEKLMELKMKPNYPLVIEIPDRHGFRNNDNRIMSYIKESIGIGI
ncbi:MAG: V/A-type H+/Na+-transporting ATPase subunit [Epulopiscium sp.]|jgi:V/A-type H+-transporting ATPase subunit F|uniref:ATP synthase subunit F n=1 Tax=Defluviitalea raffinosedens TaxID=1450156 RepID=A0A7C8LPV6_9FIRM|nr:V-type ATP synthase subunit F [Defluviitalea raffinosedens]MBZ4668107.1 synthase subunit [Defluviitaleaceae bacterium]MDK2789238.1 V/A-type H+/Na+-transporting ATPase subunit [Candidatus Epulonipiscium sp.]KAE9634046.1 ATP synthase subunit F [Defluviitalea raffinosedens]MBM7685824.1 V/A-type H+-transporting ATPase subunit F [Defluviitalea raffinosedens]HHW67988.1 ATP synthase subunit F [Candidatus Epulonipiscium sp.]